ncbi:MAG: IS3 family transposase [Proteobacteria bacterium]|nr:IS3 family transposase [Pseudomonadota bacterium]
MSGAVSISVKQAYGISRVCRNWGVSRAGFYRNSAPEPANPRKRPGPVGAMPDDDLVQNIRQLIEDSPFYGEGYRKMWARLRFKGIFTSKERVRRLMREHSLSAWLGQGTPRGSKAHDGTIIPETIDTMWGTDMTTTATVGEGQAAVFIAYDHCSGECVGIHASIGQNRFEALEPIRQAIKEYFGALGKDIADGLSLRHDHGSQYMSHDFQNEIKWLGIQSSPSFVGCVT